MPKLQKLKVILLDNDQEQVHLYLSKMGVAQYIKVDCEENGNNGFLHACEIPSDESLMNSEIQTRIKKKFGELNLKPDNVNGEVALLPGNTIKEILYGMEQKLKEIEEEPDPIIDMLDLASSLIKTTEQQLHARKISTKKLNTENIFPDGQHTSEEILSETEHELNDIEHQLEETAKHILEWQGSEYSENHIIEENPEKDTIQSSLSVLNEMTKTIDILHEAKKDMAYCDKIVYFEAWVLKKKLIEIEDKIREITHGKCVIEEEKAKPDDNVPNVIKKPPLLLEGFESLTFSLGYPRKGEINPTYLMAFTFPFLFGIMFADVGQGIILIILGLFLLLKRIRTDMNKVGELLSYLLRSAGILTLCGISSTIFGYLFGEFFGPSGVLHPVLLFEYGPFKFGGFDPMHEPLTLLRFTILIGVAFISFSLVMGVINNLKRREVARAFAKLCWIWFLIGGFVMWVYWGGISQITTWFGEGLPMFAALVIAPLVIMLVVIAKVENFMEGVDLAIEVFIESLGHTLSFCRLAALFLTHTALNAMFLELGGVENGHFPLSSIPIILIGTLLTLSIEGLLVMIHCLRLHWIELLPKFYSGDGILFKPIKIK